jgi:pimeloyl-ACP methyl ester carboxylesterase
MHEGFVSIGASRLHYSLWGTGDKLLLCFHGYGESAASFAFLEHRLGADFTILALDLPFHGHTEWNGPLFFDPQRLPALIGEIVATLPLIPDRWWLLGYSMGGRVALDLLEQIPEKIAKLVLLAPDGLKLNRWYRIATQNLTGNRAFRWTMRHPAYFFFLLKIAHKLNLANPGIYKFIENYIGDPQVRDELYKRWTVMRGFRPELPALRSIIRDQHIPVRLIYGRHDRIIHAEIGEKFRKGIEPWCTLHILDAGHQLLQPKYIAEIVALLKD